MWDKFPGSRPQTACHLDQLSRWGSQQPGGWSRGGPGYHKVEMPVMPGYSAERGTGRSTASHGRGICSQGVSRAGPSELGIRTWPWPLLSSWTAIFPLCSFLSQFPLFLGRESSQIRSPPCPTMNASYFNLPLPCFQIQSHSGMLGGRASTHELLEGTIQPLTDDDVSRFGDLSWSACPFPPHLLGTGLHFQQHGRTPCHLPCQPSGHPCLRHSG